MPSGHSGLRPDVLGMAAVRLHQLGGDNSCGLGLQEYCGRQDQLRAGVAWLPHLEAADVLPAVSSIGRLPVRAPHIPCTCPNVPEHQIRVHRQPQDQLDSS